MYCRKCRYDLRGQTVPRCPECGWEFVPGDATTYFEVIPPRWAKIVPRLRWLPPFIPTALLVASYSVLLPSLSRGPSSVSYAASENLRLIIEEWKNQSAEGGGILITSPLHLQDRLPRSLSPFSQPTRLHDRYRLGLWIERDVSLHSVVFFIYFLSVAALARGAYRRWSLRLAVVALLLLFASGYGQRFASWWTPGDYTYLADYKLVAGWDWSREPPEDPVIVAYAVSHRWWKRRAVATTHGVQWCPEAEFQRMVMEQGISLDE